MSDQHPTDFARELELAWAAGFFDGEGWTCPSLDKRNGNCIVQIGVGQVEREPLDKLVGAVGGKIYGPFTHSNRFGRKPQYRWKANGQEAKRILATLWPYLTEVKKAQAEATFAQENNSGLPMRGERTHCPHGHPYSGPNLVVRRNGSRRCRECERHQNRKARAARAKRGE